MASLTNTKIKNTYVSLLKVADNGQLDGTLQDITDGAGNTSGVQLNTGGDLAASGTVSFGSLKDTGENITISKFVDAADGIGSNNNDTTIPTSAAVVSYVASQVTLEDLDFTGDSGTGAVDLDSQTLNIVGTANEITTAAGAQTLTIGLPSTINVNVQGDLTGNVTATSVLVDGVTATTQTIGDNSTKVATTAYVDAAITAEGLDFAGDSGTGTIDLDSEVFTIAGTANEIETNATGNSLTVGLPSDVIIGNDLTVTTDASVGGTFGVTGTTTLTGDLAVDTDTLFVDVSEDRVGINKAVPAVALDVVGDITSSGTVTGSTVSATTLTGTLSTAAQTNITSVGTLSSLTVSGNVTIDSNTLFVDSSANEVGIGTTTPRSILETNGTISINDSRSSVTTGNTLTGIEIYTSDVSYNPPSGRLSMPINRILPVVEHSEGDAFGMAFYTAAKDADSVERMRIDSSGNVGIGTSSPNNYSGYNTLTLNGSTGGFLDYEANGTRVGSLLFNASSGVLKTETAIPMIFATADTERMRILQGGGITFNGDTAAANALDDYEEGTFTPTATGGTTAGTTTYDFQNGYYTKIGRQVNVNLVVGWTAMTGTGDLIIGGLPFTSANVANNVPMGVVYSSNLNWSGGTYLVAVKQANTSGIVVDGMVDDGVPVRQQCTNELVNLRITVTYYV